MHGHRQDIFSSSFPWELLGTKYGNLPIAPRKAAYVYKPSEPRSETGAAFPFASDSREHALTFGNKTIFIPYPSAKYLGKCNRIIQKI